MTEKPRGITIRISPEKVAEFHRLATRHGYSDKEFFLLGAGLAKLVLEEQELDHKLILTTADGEPLSKVVLPEPESKVIDNTVQKILGESHSSSLERAIADLDPDDIKDKREGRGV